MKKQKKFIAVGILILAIIAGISFVQVREHIRISQMSAEDKRAMSYGELTEEDKKVEGTDYVQFSAFFTRDLDGDGYAERIKGTCKEIDGKDTLYVDLNVLAQGYLKDGEITLNTKNFKWTTSIIGDDIVDGNYIGETNTIKLKDKVQNGSQKLLWGEIKSNIGNNINDYSQINSITLTGTHVIENEDGTKIEKPIEKTIELPVDWYGTTMTSLQNTYQKGDINGLIVGENAVVNFDVVMSETREKLILQKQLVEVSIPKLNGYSATEVKVTNNQDYDYNEETGILTISRESVKNESGYITSALSRTITSNVQVTYPAEACTSDEGTYIKMDVPIIGYNYGYNNTNKEFKNPYVSKSTAILTKVYSEPKGNAWNIRTYVGDRIWKGDGTRRYVVSKQNPMDIYDGNIYEDVEDTYQVAWEVDTGNDAVIKNITLEEKENDKFLLTSGKYDNMKDYITTKGIYFTDATNALGDDGYIKLYNAETGSLLETFTKENWSKYTKEKPYEVNVKSIKVETSKVNKNRTFSIYQIKEIDDSLLTAGYTKEDFENLKYIYTYLKGTMETDTGKESSISASNYAFYEHNYSVQKIYISPSSIINQSTKSVELQINTVSANYLEEKWKNGIFLIELPEDIINLNIKDITTSNTDVKIKNYSTYEENGKYYVKIFTENEEEKNFYINIKADITANPLKPTKTCTIKLYGYNEKCDNYSSQTKDIYDIDNDLNTEDYVGYSTTTLALLAPSGLLTTEYITNYDDEGNTTIAPNIADIEKSDESKTATINVGISNSYSSTISEMTILGKIPFEGNTYVITGGDLKSKFTANIKGELSIPEKLKEYATVYYSENETPSKDVTDESNGWKKTEDVTDWSKIKTYLINLGEYKLQKGESEVITYEVEVPVRLGYNSASFSDHAVYYCLDTENGKLSVKTEPNKVGIQVVGKYNLELAKNKKAYDNMFIKGATYEAKTLDIEGEPITKDATTNEQGVLNLNGLYIGREYTLKEISAQKDYIVSDEEVKFKANVNDNGELVFEVLEGNFKETPQVTQNEKGNFVVKVKTEDEAKYTLRLNKVDTDDNPLKDVRFIIKGKGNNKTLKTDENGHITIDGLYTNEEYKLKETRADGYYVDQETHTFKIVRGNDGKLKVETEYDALKNATIEETEGVAQAIATAKIENEKIPTYNLQILKVEEDNKEEDISKLKPLSGASFLVTSADTGKEEEYVTDENGTITIPDLYQYVEGKYVSGECILREIKAPDGYSNNAEEIKFKVSKNSEGNLEATIENKDSLKTYKTTISEGNTLKFVLQDKPLFKLTKVDSDTGEVLANVKFVIYEVDKDGKELDFAKDPNGNYVGEKDENGNYVVITDENGIITLPLRGGLYKAVEIGYPEGYQEKSNEQFFKVASGAEEEQQQETEDDEEEDEVDPEKIVEINYIEDLVDLSVQGTTNNSYNGYTIKLMRTLDFNDASSYKDATSTSYGDLNEDETVEDIKTELTKKEGKGFTPIGGIKGPQFQGIFDGQNNEIRNLYVNNNVLAGLFGFTQNAKIKNLGITGEVNASGSNAGGIVGFAIDDITISNCYNKATINGSQYVGGIAGNIYNNGIIKNCYNEGKINATSGNVGGVIGFANSITIKNCYNTQEVNGSSLTGGIIGYIPNNGTIKNCYNEGKVNATGSYAGGIAGKVNICSISNCYNIGDVSGTGYVGGIVGDATRTGYNSSETSGSTINNCYNKGTVNGSSAGGIIGMITHYGSINNCYNEGTIQSENGYAAGIVCYSYVYSTITNCYNIGEITGKEVAGIVYQIGNGSITNCYNTSDIKSSGWHSGGIACRVSVGDVSDCYNTGEIRGQSDIGGIVGELSTGTINNCYNTGNIISEGDYNCQGGIVGMDYGQSVTNCWNSGNITGTQYVGGIIGRHPNGGEISNCYNIGDVTSTKNTSEAGGITGNSYGTKVTNCYNEGNVSATSSGEYVRVGGIVGEGYNLSNCYNIGDVSVSSSYKTLDRVYAGPIIGEKRYGDWETNCYYLNEISVMGPNISEYGTSASSDYMKSIEFYNKLNQDDVWNYRKIAYPTLSLKKQVNLVDSTEITINNTIKKFKITTDVEEINGVKGGSITGEDEAPFETVQYNENSTKEIKMIPDSGYEITKITINGQPIVYLTNDDGSYSIPVGYFKNVKENKHIVVTYAASDEIFRINKENEQGIKLEGAEFKIEPNNDNPGFGELTANGTEYQVVDKTKEVAIDGTLTDNGNTYTFTDNGDGTYKNNNQNVSNSTANSYFKIDLSNRTGYYVVVVNANVSSESNYDIGYATITTSNSSAPAYNTTSGRFIYISGTSGTATIATDYTSQTLEGGNIYYLYLGYRKDSSGNSGTDTFTINSMNVYEAEYISYNFENQDGKYISNNVGKNNTYAYSYLPLDLTNCSGEYELNVNAEISATGSDAGFVYVTNSTEQQTYYNSNNRIIYLSGVKTATNGSMILNGGQKYYIHFGYYNGSSDAINDDKFTINSVSVKPVTYTVTTNSEGEARQALLPGKYKVTETKAPEGYLLNNEPVEVEVGEGKENSITVVNKLQREILVHHHLKDENGNYTTNKVAPDETYKDDIGKEYTTSPHVDLNKLHLEKDRDGNYVIPENATGVYTEDAIEVTYYYEAEPINLIIHHYTEGTEDKLAEDRIISIPSKVTFDEKGNYKVSTNGKYVLNKNEDYKNIIKSHELISETSTVMSELSIDDTIEFTEDAELIYYYDDREFSYRIEHYYQDRQTGEYIIDNNNTTTGKEKSGEIREIVESDKKVKPGYEYEKVEGSPLTITENEEENVIKLYYKLTNNGYSVEYYYMDKATNEYVQDKEATETYDANLNDEITTYKDKVKANYKLEKVENIPLVISDDISKNIIKVYYDYEDYKYTVHYFYDDVEDESLAEEHVAKYKDIITDYTDNLKDGFIFKEVTPAGEGEKSKLEITENEAENEIDVRYISGYKITTSVKEHTEKYKDGSSKTIKGGTISGEGLKPYESVAKGKDSTKAIVITPDEGYEIVKVVVKDGTTESELDVASFVKEDGTITLDASNGYFKNLQADKHVEVEFRKKTNVIVKYLEKETNEEVANKVTLKGVEGEEYTPERAVVPGYRTAEVEVSATEKASVTYEDVVNGTTKYSKFDENAKNTMYADTTTIIYWYEKIPEGTIIVRHIEIDEKDIQKGLTLTSGTELSSESYTGQVETTKDTIRKEFIDRDTGRKYISVNGPISSTESVIVVGKDGNSYIATFTEKEAEEIATDKDNKEENKTGEDNENAEESEKGKTEEGEAGEEGQEEKQTGKGEQEENEQEENEQEKVKRPANTIEVRYYYIKQYNVTTEVKAHTEVVNGVETKVKGGTITGDKNEITEEERQTNPEGIYEKINNKGSNDKDIVVTPEEKYRVKSLAINGLEINVAQYEGTNNKVIIQKGALKEVSEDKHIVAEFEKRPAKVIVKYIDIDTNEELKEQDEKTGKVDEQYKTERVKIPGYEKAGKEPENAEGIMTIEDTIVIYYYKKVESKPTEPEEKTTSNEPNTESVDRPASADKLTKNTFNPKTGDNVIVYVVMLVVSAFTFFVIENKRRK